jgi:hypothetical protein
MMKIKASIFLSIHLLILFPLQVFSQRVNDGKVVLKGFWQCTSMLQTADKGYVVAGSTNYGAGGSDAYVMKLDTQANVEWARTIGGPGNEVANSIISTKDGGFIFAGTTTSYGAGGNDVYVVKLNSTGNIQWTKTIGGSGDDRGTSVIQATDGGYVVSGYTNSFGSPAGNIYIIKLDSSGNEHWAKCFAQYPGSGNPSFAGSSINLCSDGGYINVSSDYTSDMQVIKIDSAGNLKWCKMIQPWGTDTRASFALRLKNGNYILAGYGAGFDCYNIQLTVIDTSCRVLSSVSGNNGWHFFTSISNIAATDNGGFVIIGDNWSDLSHTAGSMYITIYDSLANPLGAFYADGVVYNYEPVYSCGGYCVTQTHDQGYAAVMSDVNFNFIKLNSALESCALSGAWGGSTSPQSPDSVFNCTDSVASGGFVSSGGVVGSGGSDSLICRELGVQDISSSEQSEINIFPNPTNGNITVQLSNVSGRPSIEIYNVLGEKMYTALLNSGKSKNSNTTLSLPIYCNGIYLYKVLSAEGNLLSSGKLEIARN